MPCVLAAWRAQDAAAGASSRALRRHCTHHLSCSEQRSQTPARDAETAVSSALFSRSFTFLPRLGWNACAFLYAWLSFGGIAAERGAAVRSAATSAPLPLHARSCRHHDGLRGVAGHGDGARAAGAAGRVRIRAAFRVHQRLRNHLSCREGRASAQEVRRGLPAVVREPLHGARAMRPGCDAACCRDAAPRDMRLRLAADAAAARRRRRAVS